ncbi:MAG: DUF4325 domain-containing protein [Deltaproteobacteria bacterium]|nr:DUF4325 domain-containing protein [Deltaproteobacteria bacterium]MBI3295556.1 DUF4325 domain-containing protein [Deltaproteobacteria bacterium]
METKKRILQWARTHSPFPSSTLVRFLGISRQNVAQHLRILVTRGELQKAGSTRGALYSWQRQGVKRPTPGRVVVLHKKLKGLQEDIVFQEIDRKLQLRAQLGKNAHTVLSYAFTEMLNNAIDHARSEVSKIVIKLSNQDIEFEIRDFGIGVYQNVQRGFHLKTELEALEHLFKGKQTTAPEAHSGEGIFFTSKIADRFRLRSHRLTATVDNQIRETFIGEERPLLGTRVEFRIRRQTKRKLSELFAAHTNADYEFDKGQVSVQLSREGGLLARSQAKRLLAGLDRYKRITFDFAGVKELGQGFADEIFRVFRKSHPQIALEFTRTTPVVEMMIRRAIKG